MQTTKRDYYEVLGIARDADGREIKSAYRKLAVRYHPDRNPDDGEAEARFKEAAEAYAVLSNAEKRARYDRFGHGAVGGQPAAGFDPETFGDFADILGDFFGFGFGDLFGRAQRRGPAPGADLRYRLSLTLEEAAFGVEKDLDVPRLETCDTCGGLGTKGGHRPIACGACAGRGRVRVTQGFFTVARTCPQCGGEGFMITDPCDDCRGEGRVPQHRTVRVGIPAGVDTGTRLRRTGEGEHGRRGGPPGDLYIDIQVEPHEAFERHGADVVGRLELSFPEAVLGTTVEVATLHGAEELEVPPGTQHGATFRLRRKGVPHLGRRGQGDHVVAVELLVPHPRDLEDEQVQMLARWAESEGKDLKAPRNVLERVRDLFG